MELEKTARNGELPPKRGKKERKEHLKTRTKKDFYTRRRLAFVKKEGQASEL